MSSCPPRLPYWPQYKVAKSSSPKHDNRSFPKGLSIPIPIVPTNHLSQWLQ